MANTRLGLTNLLLEPGVVLKNGTGGGAPALIESAPYTMSNLLNGDRSSLWKTSVLTSAATYRIDFDLGATVSLNAGAMMGYRLATGVGPGVDFLYQTGAYNPVGVWTYIDTFGADRRDVGVVGATVSARSVRFLLSPGDVSETFSLGGFFVGEVSDLGGIHSPGGVHTPFQNRLETPLANGSVVIARLGDPGHTWTMPWNSIPLATRNILRSAQGRPTTFVLVDHEGNFFEVYLRGGALTEGLGGGVGLYDINLELVSMP